MGALLTVSTQMAQAASYVLGFVALAAAAAAGLFSEDPGDLANWTLDVLGIGFVALLVILVLITAFSLVRLLVAAQRDIELWREVGLQAANGITTLALTFTLLGISLGIGGLAGQELTPETVQAVIRELTANFSLAFVTTIIGLPVSALLRAVISISATRRLLQEPDIIAAASPQGRPS